MPLTDDELVAAYRGRRVDHDTKAIYRGWLERRLLVHRCDDCRLWIEPPSDLCPACWSTAVTPRPVAGTGTIFMVVLLHQGPPAAGVDYATPHPVVVVELDEQPALRLSTTVVGASNEEIRIGRRVRLDWIERDGVPLPVVRFDENGDR